MTNRSGTPGGFAVMEVAVALVIAGMLLLGARLILEHVGDAGDRILASAAAADREANGERLLRALAGRVDAAGVVNGSVSGDGRAVRLSTWCDVPGGWQERCRVTLSFEPVEEGWALIARGVAGSDIALMRTAGHGRLLYLSDARRGGAWLESWPSRLTTPPAIGVVRDGDTLIVRIGARG